MIKLRSIAAAVLMNSGDYLLMRRAPGRELAPGIWAAVGGHVEAAELNDPQAACLREIREETGLGEKEITGLRLRYITLRRSKDEIRIQYVFFGHSKTREVAATVEGELHWVKAAEVLDRDLSFAVKACLTRALEPGSEAEPLLIGTIGATGGHPTIHWSPLRDWEGI